MEKQIAAILVFMAFSSVSFAEPVKVADRVVIEKSRHQMTLYSGNVEIATFPVSIGRSPNGAKECEGDNKTPEGIFKVTEHKENSAFHRALRLSYPEAPQIEVAKAKGCSPGGDVMIHGIRNGFGWLGRLHRLVDWTRGCIALTNEEVEKVWSLVPDGTVVEIKA